MNSIQKKYAKFSETAKIILTSTTRMISNVKFVLFPPLTPQTPPPLMICFTVFYLHIMIFINLYINSQCMCAFESVIPLLSYQKSCFNLFIKVMALPYHNI